MNRRTWLLALGLVLALIPAFLFLIPAGYFASSDGMIHLYRLFELDRAIGEGVFFPRWFPLSAYGYGLPVLNYYPPLMYYLAELFHLLGAGYIAAIKLTIATSFIIAAFSMFLFARDWMNDGAAFVAAIAYAYSPYLLSDAYVRGNFPEMLAMSLLPLALWAISDEGRKTEDENASVLRPSSSVLRPFAFAQDRLLFFVFIFTAIILSHHLTAMQFAGLVVVYAVWVRIRSSEFGVRSSEFGVQSSEFGRRSAVGGQWSVVPSLLLRACLRLSSFVFALTLALALSAFYWVPALAELNLVYVESASL
ncbi:MAG: 6-pyruvoyl-tetrahydropterin synthase-related protein, partial [Anaerolineae bacterium]|nr:6-pyruvoyl-tetrahydropterin synthase-related protein [Anaerolineae bacterium]